MFKLWILNLYCASLIFHGTLFIKIQVLVLMMASQQRAAAEIIGEEVLHKAPKITKQEPVWRLLTFRKEDTKTQRDNTKQC